VNNGVAAGGEGLNKRERGSAKFVTVPWQSTPYVAFDHYFRLFSLFSKYTLILLSQIQYLFHFLEIRLFSNHRSALLLSVRPPLLLLALDTD